MMKQAYEWRGSMRKNRYLLCILLSGWMIYFALPKLQFFNEGAGGLFAIAWTIFALMVLTGNLVALFNPDKERKNDSNQKKKGQARKKIRSFHG
jgi:hypothetical protein